jgi:poly(3-hydroxybutyrate) depolymerase
MAGPVTPWEDDLMVRRLVVGVGVLVAAAGRADDTLVTFTSSQTTAPLPFVEYLPPNYSTRTQPEALVVFFHGVGESGGGTDATAVFNAMTAHGPLQQVRSAGTGAHRFQSTHRAIVLAPRNPSGLWNASLASQFFGWARGRYRIDADRVYVTGVSAGGGPSWTVPKDHPGVVAATVPVCPVQQLWPVTAMDAVEYRRVAVWAFHGFGDPMVPKEESIRWMNAIGQAVSRDPAFASVMTSYPGVNGLSAGSDQTAAWTPSGYVWRMGVGTTVSSPLRLTLYNRNDHFIWPDVYSSDAMWNWLFAQRRSLNVDPGLDGGVGPVLDAGTPGVDAGQPVVDAGTPVADAGVTSPDAGAPDAGDTSPDAGAPDAGEPAADGGAPGADAGGVEPDAGVMAVDAGPSDAGTVVVDAGFEPDAGSRPADASSDDALGGCGCGSTSPLWLLGALLLLAGRRTRARGLNQA